jgi:hypothetical protein
VDLQAFVQRYILEHDLEPGSVEQVCVTVRIFERFLGRPATLDDLVSDTVNRWLVGMQDAGRARETVRSKRRMLLTLWNAADMDGLVGGPPSRVRRIKRVERIPECWTLSQLESLLRACETLKGDFAKLALPKRLYMRSRINAQYDTGLRHADIGSLERGWIWEGGFISIVQQKTGRCHRCRLRAETLEEIDELMAIMPKRRLIWPAFCARRRYFRFFRMLVKRAGLRGSGKWIRRSSATYIERDHPGTAWMHLGHSRPGLDRQSYIDERLIDRMPPLPPKIAGA